MKSETKYLNTSVIFFKKMSEYKNIYTDIQVTIGQQL